MKQTHQPFDAVLAAVIALALHAGTARAQPYPNKPIRLIMPVAAGGPSDTAGRVMSQKLSAVLGQTIVIDNRAGAGGTIAGEAFARSAVYFHVAQATNHHDLAEKERLQRRQHAAYRKAMPHLRPAVQALDIPYQGSSFPGYLRLPASANGPAPCVLMLAGLDSTKEELACYEKGVSIGGFYDWPWERFRQASREEFAMGTHAKSLDEAEKIARTFTLTGLMHKVKVPLLIVHSQGDVVCRHQEAERMAHEARAAGGSVTLALYPEGNHVCDNIPYKVRPMMADWMARQLRLPADWWRHGTNAR